MTTAPFNRDTYEQHTFKNHDADHIAVHGVCFYECAFTGCTFREASFKACRFNGCTFESCDLSLADLTDSVFAGVRFINSQLVGVNWAKALWNYPYLPGALTFENCALNYGTFIGLTLPELVMKDCVARDLDLREATLTSADFSGTDFEQSHFLNCDLTEADFRGAKNYAIDAGQNTLTGAKFRLPEALALLYGLDILLEE